VRAINPNADVPAANDVRGLERVLAILESSMNVPNLQLVWNRDWINLLYEPNTFIGSVVESAFERAENPDLGPLPAEALEAFKSQVRRNG
jgi:hypothetical protein